MSTASRNCGMDGGARAGKRNALSAPGVNGKLREHYDSRASLRQLGSPDGWTGPKWMPGAENAAPASRAQASSPTSTPKLREPRLRQSPPPAPARPPPPKGAAGRLTPQVVERDKPLKRCPNLACERSGKCRALAAAGEHCRRWYETKDEQRMRIARNLLAAARGFPKPVYASEQEVNDNMAELYKALSAMMDGD